MPRGVYKHPSQCGFQKGHPDFSSKESRKRQAEKTRGKRGKQKNPNSWNKGKVMTEEYRKRVSRGNYKRYLKFPHIKEQVAQKLRGEKCHLWRGGISFEPYSVDWTETLRRSIRERDHYICQLCEKQQSDKVFPVHHIDYDKKNSSPENLITLCRSCHSKTNSNRDYWTNYFKVESSKNLILKQFDL